MSKYKGYKNTDEVRAYAKKYMRSFRNKGNGAYSVWILMKQRCLNPKNPAFINYGQRGITVCDRWKHSFDNFLEDMGERPSKLHSIDRIDNNGNYEPLNCRWATRKVQNNNSRNNRYIEFRGQTKTMAQWCEIYKINPTTFYRRYYQHKWSLEKSLTAPLQPNNREAMKRLWKERRELWIPQQ